MKNFLFWLYWCWYLHFVFVLVLDETEKLDEEARDEICPVSSGSGQFGD